MREALRKLIQYKRKYLPALKFGVNSFSLFVHKYLKNGALKIQGHKMFVDELDSLQLIENNEYEPEMVKLFESVLKEGDTALDIGAHIGCHTLNLAKLVGPTGKVIAFEPNPDNFNLLKKNIEINGYKNIEANNMAVADASGEMTLFQSLTNSGDHRLFSPDEERKEIKISSVSLDDFFSKKDSIIALIKIDVQGAEYYALEGMLNLLKHNENIVIFTEYWPYGLKKAGQGGKQYLSLLKSLGFCFIEIKESRELGAISTDELINKLNAENAEDYCNLICIKGEKNQIFGSYKTAV